MLFKIKFRISQLKITHRLFKVPTMSHSDSNLINESMNLSKIPPFLGFGHITVGSYGYTTLSVMLFFLYLIKSINGFFQF